MRKAHLEQNCELVCKVETCLRNKVMIQVLLPSNIGGPCI